MRKWLSISISLVLLLSIVTGCSGNGESKDKGAPGSDRVEITYWGEWGGEGEKQFMTIIDKFNASQDRIRVKYVIQQDLTTKFLTAATSGNAPDVLFWDRWRTALYAPKNVLHPIDEYMDRDGVPYSDFYGEALKELSWKDNLYGLPLTVDARALFYNKKMLDEAGLKPPTTWEELATSAKALTKWNGDKLEVSGLSLQDAGLFSMWLMQAGGSMMDGEKTNFNNEHGLSVLNYWDRLMNQEKVYKIGFEAGLGEGQDSFVNGKVAMHYTGPWMLSTYEQYGDELEYGIVPPPAGPNGDRGAGMGGFGLVIPEASKHKEEAWEFIKFWLAEKENALLYAKTSLNIPGNLQAIEDPFFKDDPFWKPFLETLEFAKIRPTHTGYSVMEVDALIPNLQLFLNGDQSAEQTLQKAQEQGDILLEQNKE